MLQLIHQRCLTGLFHLFASCWQRMRYYLACYKMLASRTFSVASCYSNIYSLLLLCMVAQVLYVTRSSNLQKVQSKQLMSLLWREVMSWARQILQGILCSNNSQTNVGTKARGYSTFFHGLTRFLFNLFFYANRTTQSLLSAVIHVIEKYLRQEALGAVSLLQFPSTCEANMQWFTHLD